MSRSFLEVTTAPSTGRGMAERKLPPEPEAPPPDEDDDDLGEDGESMPSPLHNFSMGTGNEKEQKIFHLVPLKTWKGKTFVHHHPKCVDICK
jgi:hypothetical protein